MLTYTLCFVLHGNQALMMLRARPPHQFKWNALGGKLEKDETPLDGVLREVYEESHISIDTLYLAGKVTWANVIMDDDGIREYLPQDGMYVYVAALPRAYKPDYVIDRSRGMAEGRLEWLKIDAMLDPAFAPTTTENFPHFFPTIMEDERPYEYEFLYEDGVIVEVRKRPLTAEEVSECQKSRYGLHGISIS